MHLPYGKIEIIRQSLLLRPTIHFSNKEISIKTFYSKQNLHIKLMFDYYNVILKD